MSRHPGRAIYATMLPFLRFAFWQDFHFIVVVCQKVAECVTFPFYHPLTILRSPEHVPVGILRSHYVINPIHARNTKHELIIYVHGCYIVNRASTCVLALFFCVVTSFVICTPHETRGLLRWSEQDVIGCGMRHVLGGRGFTWRTLMERSRSEDIVIHRDNIKMDHKTGWEGVDCIKAHETSDRAFLRRKPKHNSWESTLLLVTHSNIQGGHNFGIIYVQRWLFVILHMWSREIQTAIVAQRNAETWAEVPALFEQLS